MQNQEEGYIKFKVKWEEKAPLNDDHLPELIHYRNELFKMGLIGAFDDEIGFGNISCRVAGDQFIISGTQTGHLPVLDQNHFCLVEACDLIKNELYCSGPVKASSESLTHFAFYKSYAHINAVIHVHTYQLWNNLLVYAPTTDPSVAYGTTAMANEILRILNSSNNQKKIIVTAGHRDGIFTYGGSLKETFEVITSLLT